MSLNCVADDGFGEELQVIWEVEPGARVIDRKSDLPAPTGFDTPGRLEAFLDAVRWGAAAADPRAIQSPFRSGITIAPDLFTLRGENDIPRRGRSADGGQKRHLPRVSAGAA